MHPWRARLERLLGPLARRSPLSPNAITSIALVMNLSAALLLGLASSDPRLFLVAPVLIGVAGLLDALDGLVARFQGKASQFGDFLDHFADRVSDLALVAAWTVGARVTLPLAVCTVVMVSLTGYVGTQIEATFGHRSYSGLGRGEFVLSIFILPLVAFILIRLGIMQRVFFHLTPAEWLTAIFGLFALLGVIQRVRRAAAISANSEPPDA